MNVTYCAVKDFVGGPTLAGTLTKYFCSLTYATTNKDVVVVNLLAFIDTSDHHHVEKE